MLMKKKANAVMEQTDLKIRVSQATKAGLRRDPDLLSSMAS